MKTTPALLIIGLILAGYACNAQNTGNSTNATVATNDLGCDIRDGKTNKIARIYKVTPTHVYVIYEGNNSGRNIPREELSEPLKSRFPYDAAAVASIQAQQAEARLLLSERRDKIVRAEIDKLVNEDSRLQAEVNLLDQAPAGNGRKVRMLHLMDQQKAIRERISKLRLQQSAAL